MASLQRAGNSSRTSLPSWHAFRRLLDRMKTLWKPSSRLIVSDITYLACQTVLRGRRLCGQRPLDERGESFALKPRRQEISEAWCAHPAHLWPNAFASKKDVLFIEFLPAQDAFGATILSYSETMSECRSRIPEREL